MTIKKGQRIYWKPEFMDAGDENYIFLAAEDVREGQGLIRVAIHNPRAVELDLSPVTYQTTAVSHIAKCQAFSETN